MNKQLAIPWQSPLAQLLMTQIAFNSRIKAMQAESANWHKEHSKWKKDIAGWQKKQRRIEAILYQLERELPDYRDVAARLWDIIEVHEHRLIEHEKLLTGYLSEGGKNRIKWTELDMEHGKQVELHAGVREDHDAFQAVDLAAMKKVGRLVERLRMFCH